MNLLDWAPLIWAIRIVLLLVIGAGVWVGFLYFLRYLRPSNIRDLAERDVAEIEEVRALGSAVKLASQHAMQTQEKLNELDGILLQIDERLTQVEDAHQKLSGVVKQQIQDQSTTHTQGRE